MSGFPFYKVLFVAEILVAEFLFMFRLKKRKGYPLRLAAVTVVALTAAFFIPLADNAVLFSAEFLLLFFITAVCMKFCYAEPSVNIVFCVVAAYTLQHFSFEAANCVISLITQASSPLFGIYGVTPADLAQLGAETVFVAAVYIMCYFTCYTGAYFLFCRKIKKDEELKIKNGWLLFLIAAGLLVNILFNSMLVSLGENYSLTVSVILSAYNIICCFFLTFAQFSLVRTNRLESNLAFINYMLDKEKEQYELLSRNIDLVNLKCHDIKHQIRKAGEGKGLSDDAIRELENTVSIYDSIAKTGNEAIDAVITEKNTVCAGEGIALDYAIDGKALSFMQPGELYSLFGNLIDNAVEAVMKSEDPHRRVITVKVFSRRGFAMINVSNYYEGNIAFDSSGMPVTSRDRRYHGYGIKSVRYIAEKYGGNVAVKADGDVFRLSVLIPVGDGEGEKTP